MRRVTETQKSGIVIPIHLLPVIRILLASMYNVERNVTRTQTEARISTSEALKVPF